MESVSGGWAGPNHGDDGGGGGGDGGGSCWIGVNNGNATLCHWG